MKFPKQFLRYEEWDKTVEERITGHSRWSIHYETVFMHDGRFYKTTYSRGATESQDERPYEYEPDEIECPEVKAVEKVITVWEGV